MRATFLCFVLAIASFLSLKGAVSGAALDVAVGVNITLPKVNPEIIYIRIADAIDCHGYLITEKAILTTASCFFNLDLLGGELLTDATRIKIAVGSFEVNATLTSTIEVASVTIHPTYRYYPLSGVHENNIAIILVKAAVTLDGVNVAPIKIVGSSSGKADGNLKVPSPVIAGFVQINNTLDPTNIFLQTMIKIAPVVVMSQKNCAAIYAKLDSSMVYVLSSTMLCTNVTATASSTCKGDDGAGLRYTDKKTQKTVLFALATPPIESTCPTTLPSLYTNVGAYAKWIGLVTGLSIK